MGRFGTAWNAFWSILGSQEAADAWRSRAEQQEPPSDESATESSEDASQQLGVDSVHTLVVLQREGRLIDFLCEDIEGFADAQVGAAVRQVHANCRKALEQCFGLEPIHPEQEGAQVQVEEGFDPCSIRITGNASGTPPFSGILRHKGWRATKVDLPKRSDKLDPLVIVAAEVETK